MEKIIFFGLAIPILAFVLYLGGTAIMKGFEAKRENKSNESLEDQDHEDNLSDNNDKLTDELNKLNQLLKDGVLTEEEFQKAKKKILGSNSSPTCKKTSTKKTENKEEKPNIVLEVFQKGFKFKDRVIKPAMVVVNKK